MTPGQTGAVTERLPIGTTKLFGPEDQAQTATKKVEISTER